MPKTETFFHCLYEQMADAQEEIKAHLTVVSPDVQSRKRDDEKEPVQRDPLLRRDTISFPRREEKEISPVLGICALLTHLLNVYSMFVLLIPLCRFYLLIHSVYAVVFSTIPTSNLFFEDMRIV